MVTRPRLDFDESSIKVIKFLQDCGLPKPVAQTYLAYLSQLYPYPLVEDLKGQGIAALRRTIEGEHSLEATEAFVQLLASHGFMDNLTGDYIYSVIRGYIQKQKMSDDEKTGLLTRLDHEIMPIMRSKLEAYGERRRKHYLHEPQWVISKESKDSFLQALNNADRAIKLPAYSGETFFESWNIDRLFIEKLKQGVSIKILFIHPELASRWERRPPAKETVEMVGRFLKKVSEEKRAFERAGKRSFGEIEIRWIRQPRFAFFTGLLTYVDQSSLGGAVARFNIHRVGLERGTVGLIVSSDNDIGDTTLFKVLETYFDEAWKKAEPLSGFGLWQRRVLDFTLSYQGVVLTVLIIAGLLFVNSTVATVLFFVYPIFLALWWRLQDEWKGVG